MKNKPLLKTFTTLFATALCATVQAAPLTLDTSALTNDWNDAAISVWRCREAFRNFGDAVATANAEAAAKRTRFDTTARIYLKSQMEKAQSEGDLDRVLVFKSALESARDGVITGNDAAIVKLRESYDKQIALADKALLDAGLAAARAFAVSLDAQKAETTKKGDLDNAQKIAAFQKKIVEWTKAAQGKATQTVAERPTAAQRPQPQSGHSASSPLIHRWSFNGNLSDSVGGQNASAFGNVTRGGRLYRLEGGTHGSSYIDLGSNILPRDGRSATFEIWATRHSQKTWNRVFDIGSGTGDFMMMTWGDNRTEASIPCKVNIARVIGSRNAIDLGMVKDNTEYHLAMVCSHESDGSWLVTFYLQDAATGKTLNKVRINTKGKGWSLEQQGMLNCWLGHSQWEPDQDANASYNEVRVWATALTEEQLTKSARRGPDAFITPNSLSLW